MSENTDGGCEWGCTDASAPTEDVDRNSGRSTNKAVIPDSERILETIADGVYTLDENFVMMSVNEAIVSMTGYSREELLGSHASMLAGDRTLSMADEMVRNFQTGAPGVGRIDTSIRTADGMNLPIETRFSTIELADGSRRQVGVVRDITDRKRYEEILSVVNRSARRLLRTETETAVYECVVHASASVLDDACVVAYRFEDSSTALSPIASHGTNPSPCGPGSDVWEAFATAADLAVESPSDDADIEADTEPSEAVFGSIAPDDGRPGAFDWLGDESAVDLPSGRVLERYDDDDSVGTGCEGDVNRTVFATLDEYGLLAITTQESTWSNDVTEFVELLAANAVAALERVEREAELAQRREALLEREQRLTRLHEFNDLLRRVNDALVDAETVDEVTNDICRLLCTSDPVEFAWIGEHDPEQGLHPRAWAGRGKAYMDGVRDGIGRDENEPTVLAATEGEPVLVSAIADGLRQDAWRQHALSFGYQSVVSVPLVYNGLRYGVLSVYADCPNAFDGAFGEMLAELGTTAANAINGIETKRSLRRESVTEFEFRFEDSTGALSRLAAALGTSIRLDGVVPGEDGRSILYLTADSDFRPLYDLEEVERIRPLGTIGDARSAEVTLTETTSIAERITDFGATLRDATADAGGVDVEVRLPHQSDVRSIVETLEEEFRSVELRARRDRETRLRTPQEFLGALERRLTDRQLEAVRTAYLGGYFEWPRASTGEETAATLGITQPTFNRHLRVAERKTFDLLFESDHSGQA